MSHFGICVKRFRMPAETDKAVATGRAFQEIFKIRMVADIHLLPVVQSSPLEMLVVYLESQWMNQMQPDFSCPAKPGNISRIRGYFRLKEDHIQVGVFQGAMAEFRYISCHWIHCILPALSSG